MLQQVSVLCSFLWQNDTLLYGYTIFCFYIQWNGHLGCFHLLAVMNNPPVHFYPKSWAFRGLGRMLLPPPAIINPILPWRLASWVCQLCSFTGPELRRALCSVVAVWKFLIRFGQEAPHFIHFAPGSTNYKAGPAFWAVWAEPWKYYLHVPKAPVICQACGFLCPRV